MTEFWCCLGSSPGVRSLHSTGYVSSRCLVLPLFSNLLPSSNLYSLGYSSTPWASSPNSAPHFRSGRLSRPAGLPASQECGVRGRAVPMRPTLWRLWRCHRGGGCRGDGTQFVRDSGSRKARSALLLNCALPFGSTQRPSGSETEGCRLLTCNGASSGRGGDTQVGSSEAFENIMRTIQPPRTAPQNLNWLGFRGMSQEARRQREVDEGDWRYSPEWWGTQAGGWGHNAGDTIFEAPSLMGNGVVSVTSHPASTPTISYLQVGQKLGLDTDSQGPTLRELGYEWRVLRFNSVTRQSVAKVKALETTGGDVILLQQPNCVGFEYVKSMISAGLSAASLSGLDLQRVQSGDQKIRILCIGLGGGSLPLFLAHSLPGATVEVVEIDAAVILAAVKAMGFPPSDGALKDQITLWGDMLERLIVHENDGEVFVCEEARKAKLQYDLVFVDAYDGEDVVPLKLWDRRGPFLSSLSSLLNAEHGTVVVNLHTDSPPPSIFARLSGKFGPGFDPSLPQGSRVQEAALAYRDILLNNIDETRTNLRGLAFSVAVSLQGNISLVVTRGDPRENQMYKALAGKTADTELALIRTFAKEAERVQNILNVPFDMSKRVERGFQIVNS